VEGNRDGWAGYDPEEALGNEVVEYLCELGYGVTTDEEEDLEREGR
jgi:hypothetical protein